jgi:hypothetical protein|tara:strand:+ start:41 stop:148 length:108 start_codon:yes stop_codon:yes gene_type:complete
LDSADAGSYLLAIVDMNSGDFYERAKIGDFGDMVR